MDLELVDAITASIVVFFGLVLTLRSFFLYYKSRKKYYLFIGLVVFLISFSYIVVPISYITFILTSGSLGDVPFLLIGWAGAPLAACIVAYMSVDIFYSNWRKPTILILFGTLTVLYYMTLFVFTSENIIRFRGTKAILVGPALYMMIAMMVILTVMQVGGFLRLRRREETSKYHKKLTILIVSWLLVLVMAELDTIAGEPISSGIVRAFFCVGLLLFFYGYSPA